MWPPPTGRTCWPSSRTSPTGAHYISASALCSTSTESKGERLCQTQSPLFVLTPPACVTLFHLISRLDPTSALDFLWACSHIPRIWQGRDQKTPQVWSQLILLIYSSLARLLFLISYAVSLDSHNRVRVPTILKKQGM